MKRRSIHFAEDDRRLVAMLRLGTAFVALSCLLMIASLSNTKPAAHSDLKPASVPI
jgi:hypothetical protein